MWNTISVFEQGSDTPAFYVVAPLMTDASGEVSSDVKLSLREEGGKKIVTVTPDAAWLNSLERAYPVKIDPTFVIKGDDIVYVQLTTNSSPGSVRPEARQYGGTIVGYDDGWYTGGWPFLMSRTYVWFYYDFTLIPSEAVIDSATFLLCKAKSC
jgi:hypothetical protein